MVFLKEIETKYHVGKNKLFLCLGNKPQHTIRGTQSRLLLSNAVLNNITTDSLQFSLFLFHENCSIFRTSTTGRGAGSTI